MLGVSELESLPLELALALALILGLALGLVEVLILGLALILGLMILGLGLIPELILGLMILGLALTLELIPELILILRLTIGEVGLPKLVVLLGVSVFDSFKVEMIFGVDVGVIVSVEVGLPNRVRLLEL